MAFSGPSGDSSEAVLVPVATLTAPSTAIVYVETGASYSEPTRERTPTSKLT